MKKNFIFFFILIIFISITVYLYKSNLGENATFHVENSLYTLELKGWVEDVKPTKTVEEFQHATYIHNNYKRDDMHFRLTIVNIHQGDTLYFAKNYRSNHENSVQMNVIINDTYEEQIRYLNWEEKSWETIGSAFPAINHSIYVDGKQAYYRIGKINENKELGYTVFQRIQSQPVERKKHKNRIQYTLALQANSDKTSDTWGILSSQPIIKWEDPFLSSHAANIEFDFVKELTMNGAFYATPNSYTPYLPNSFYYNPANLDGLRSIPYLSTKEYGSIFHNIATHLAYVAVKNQNDLGYWPTYPLSQWLNKEYGIEYLYMDNRRNIDNTMFLLAYNKIKADPLISEVLNKWNEYHLDYISEYKIPIPNGGIFIPDYVGDTQSKKSHVSLNHLAANLNYLLMSYLETKNEKQLQFAESILQGITNTKDLWVAPDHNLYYALTTNLETYPAEDYYTLTRDDLLQTQELLVNIFGVENEDIQYLIDEKNTWLLENFPEKY